MIWKISCRLPWIGWKGGDENVAEALVLDAQR